MARFYIPTPISQSTLLFALRLSIETQGSDEQLAGGWHELAKRFTQLAASTIYGHISWGGWDPTGKVVFEHRVPVAGFVDDAGVIKLSPYQPEPPEWSGWSVYVGRLTRPQLGLSIISGNADSSTFVRHSGNIGPDTFSVKRLGLDFSDSTFLDIYEHIPF
jgi:hypothetical protein